MTDKEIIDALLDRNQRATREFFYQKCRPLFLSIIKKLFDKPIDYDEFVDEVYILLMEDDARRLRQFDYRSTICQWMKTVVIRYFLAKKDKIVIDDVSNEHHLNSTDESTEEYSSAEEDVRRLLSLMPNKRYAFVIQRLMLDEAPPKDVAKEMNISVANLYNIKSRAMAMLSEVALNDVKKFLNK